MMHDGVYDGRRNRFDCHSISRPRRGWTHRRELAGVERSTACPRFPAESSPCRCRARALATESCRTSSCEEAERLREGDRQPVHQQAVPERRAVMRLHRRDPFRQPGLPDRMDRLLAGGLDHLRRSDRTVRIDEEAAEHRAAGLERPHDAGRDARRSPASRGMPSRNSALVSASRESGRVRTCVAPMLAAMANCARADLSTITIRTRPRRARPWRTLVRMDRCSTFDRSASMMLHATERALTAMSSTGNGMHCARSPRRPATSALPSGRSEIT